MSEERDVVDAWIQPVTARFLRYEAFESVRRWMGLTELPDSVPSSITVDAMDAGGVRLALASAWTTPEGVLISNDEIHGLTQRHPGRFAAIASVDLTRPMQAVRELRHRVRDQGFKGLRVLPWVWQTPPNDRLFYPLYAECVELGVPFCTQVGHTGPLRPSEPGRPIPYLDQVALDFPELTIVGGHIGYPWTQEMIALATKYPNVYIDTSAYKPSRYPPELVAFMKAHGRKKVLFGSNFPMIQPKAALDEVGALGLSPESEQLFLSGNCRRVFALDMS